MFFSIPYFDYKHNISFAAGLFLGRVEMEIKEEINLVHTVNHWKAGRVVLEEFLRLHPELHIRYTENVYNNFVRIHGNMLAALDVMRKTHTKAPAMFDVTKFDNVAFDVLTQRREFHKPSASEVTPRSNRDKTSHPHQSEVTGG